MIAKLPSHKAANKIQLALRGHTKQKETMFIAPHTAIPAVAF